MQNSNFTFLGKECNKIKTIGFILQTEELKSNQFSHKQLSVVC